MLGGLLTLTSLSIADVVFNRSIGAVRNLLFVVITGTSAVLITGLPEVFFPGLPERLLMLLKASLGPLAGAMALNYLGNWLGGIREDVIVYRLTAWGGGAVFVAAIVLAGLAAQVAPADFRQLLLFTAAANMVPVLLALAAVIRAATLGDPLARWMVLACAGLAAMVTGLYLRGLDVPGFGLGTWIATAAVTVAYFLIASVLVIVRNRQTRQLARLAGLQQGADPATGLPTGSTLLTKVEHAFWRTARFHGECTVVCLYLRNLYELGESAGRGAEHQILAAMAARIRRTAGFRCVVGLYHPRCFVVVISADKRREFVGLTVSRLRSLVAKPLIVVGQDDVRHHFAPRLGVGVVTLDAAGAKPMDALNEAERLAMATVRDPKGVTEDEIETAWDDIAPRDETMR